MFGSRRHARRHVSICSAAKAASTRASAGRRRSQFRAERPQDCALHGAIVRCARIANVLHLPGEDNPDRLSRLQFP
jgi:hypothetical protein